MELDAHSCFGRTCECRQYLKWRIQRGCHVIGRVGWDRTIAIFSCDIFCRVCSIFGSIKMLNNLSHTHDPYDSCVFNDLVISFWVGHSHYQSVENSQFFKHKETFQVILYSLKVSWSCQNYRSWELLTVLEKRTVDPPYSYLTEWTFWFSSIHQYWMTCQVVI